MRRIYLAPSDIRYLIDKCPRCWWMKTRNLPVPHMELPAIFKHVDKGMKRSWGAAELRALGIPVKELLTIEYVKSQEIVFEDLELSIIISGFLDRAALLDDDTFAVLDYKMTDPNNKGLQLFARQLHAYVQCLEAPAIGTAYEVTQIGLVVFNAYDGEFKISKSEIEKARDGNAALSFSCGQMGRVIHYPMDLDRAGFYAELRKIAELAAPNVMPDSGHNCMICAHAKEVIRYWKEHDELKAKEKAA